jgi:hypothetical protein
MAAILASLSSLTERLTFLLQKYIERESIRGLVCFAESILFVFNHFKQFFFQIFQGNTSCRCSRKHLVRPFLVRSLRFLPTSWKNRPCLRVDVYGVYKGNSMLYMDNADGLLWVDWDVGGYQWVLQGSSWWVTFRHFGNYCIGGRKFT